MLIALSVMLAVFAALMIFRQVHSRRQKAVAEIVAERLHVSDLEKYVDSEYSGRYVDAILCEELKSSMLDVYNRVCDVERRSRILMSHNPSIAKFKDDFENLHSIVDAHNDRFKDDKLREHKAFFDTVLAYPLDNQQRRSIVSEEQNCLVVSSAGSGKTSSIVGKVEYLIQKKHIRPERILLISYTHKAATELTERMRILACADTLSTSWRLILFLPNLNASRLYATILMLFLCESIGNLPIMPTIGNVWWNILLTIPT